MRKRVDALVGREPATFRGELLSRELDDNLQSCVEMAAHETGAPIALVSLVLERTQFFRAHCGLPSDLEISRATDRTASFCQFVARDGKPFEVNDAPDDDRIPKDLVERYGIRAYLGVPVMADNQVIGSLCVIDTVPRPFNNSERDALSTLGLRASARLQELADQRRLDSYGLVQQGSAPAFSEVRNLLVPLTAGVDGVRMLLSDVVPVTELLNSDLSDAEVARGLGALREAAASLSRIDAELEEISGAARRLHRTVTAIEAVTVVSSEINHLRTVVDAGLELAHHLTKLVGGVELEPPSSALVQCPLAHATALVSTMASAIASLCTGRDHPLMVSTEVGDAVASVTVRTGAPLNADKLDEAAARLERFAATGPMTVGRVAGGFRLDMPVAKSA